MVAHASEYPWSSYQHNAAGREIGLITPHELYDALGKTPKARQSRYRAMFKGVMADADIQDIRDATNKSWLLNDQWGQSR